ncbi:response regulator [Ruegeria sp. A3M17]|uniref:hybrid sensor histidine kinase/response regulator n=1 Tax=Ruegeria sp. A3M17 TaxID=2267229 RepID=UPI000DEA0367|nr:response regulator [Ruegeria sp. A3M17]RBW53798.1 hybrid sensor histidine kinase/response regulator [Ruegeria sp. A3M17]
MKQEPGVSDNWRWVSENTIPVRIGSLSALLLAALVVSTIVMVYDLARNQARIQDANTEFHRLEVAGQADRQFGEMRYWLTDLSVSLLTLSERRANEASTKLNSSLEQLSAFAPESAASVQEQANSYYETSMQAADAYTDGNRVLGNTLLAQARVASDAVDKTLTQLVEDLSKSADQTRNEATVAAKAAMNRAIIACVVIVILGALLTWRALRSIVVPLHAINIAISGLIRGERDVALPPEGPDELGRMSQALRALRDSQDKRRELEEEARAQRNTILTAIETIPDGFALFDNEDELILFNDRFRSIFAHVDDILVPGTRFEDILRLQLERKSVDTGDVPDEEWISSRLARHRRPDGDRQEVLLGGAWIQVSKRQTPDGGTVAVYSDISDLKSKQEQLEEANAQAIAASSAKSQFLASMSHELRTPLNAIIGYSEMLSEDAQEMGFETAIDDLEKIMASGRHLLSLINDVLDLSKIEAGKMEMYPERFALRPLLDEVASTVVPLVSKNGNDLVLSCDLEDTDEIETDKTKLRQNLFNLLSNAAKFTESGKIELLVSKLEKNDQDYFRFSVADEGIGMTPKQRDKLFQAFVQADQSTTRNFGGTGLGLAIAQEFTRMMGGHITVDSKEGVGSTFSFEIPARYDTVSTSINDHSETSPDTALGRVLIVDDEEDARNAVAQIVREEGYDVLLASNAEAGMEIARSQKPDVILLDVIMPERDGWSMLKELKADAKLCETPVVLATIVADRDMGLAFGAIEHLIKPIDPARLISTLDSIATGRDKDVLIVDDDMSTRNLFRRILTRNGWTVREAADGHGALSQLKSKRPTLMVLDIMMPNVDGFDVLKTVRTTDGLADLPVIVATSKDLTRDELDWLKAHSDEVIRKGDTGRGDLIAALKRQLQDYS